MPSCLPVIHLESPKWQGESHPLSRDWLRYAVEFAPFARHIDESVLWRIASIGGVAEGSADHVVIQLSLLTIDYHRRLVFANAPSHGVDEVAAVGAKPHVNPQRVVVFAYMAVDNDTPVRTRCSSFQISLPTPPYDMGQALAVGAEVDFLSEGHIPPSTGELGPVQPLAVQETYEASFSPIPHKQCAGCRD